MMKKQFLAAFAVCALVASAHVSSIEWTALSKDLGKVKVNEAVTFDFSFTNTGEEPVQILKAKGSCGCTDITYTEEAIAPGETASIGATFKTSKAGVFNKSVTVHLSNQTEPVKLSFSGEAVE